MKRFYVDVLDGIEVIDSYMFDNEKEQIEKYNELSSQYENVDKFQSSYN